MIYIDLTTQEYEKVNAPTTEIYYDDSNNLVLKNNHQISLYVRGGDPIVMNSYYHNTKDYLVRGTQVYGPHAVYKEGKKVGNLEKCQVFPEGKYMESEIYPVYVKGKGYYFYNYENKRVIDKAYYDAEPFNSESRAIVEITDKGYSLIDENGNVLTHEIFASIKNLGHSLYAVYRKNGVYGIIDKDGNEIYPIEYTSMNEDPIVEYDGKFYLHLQKNGRTYVYELESQDEVFSAEGNFILNEKGYYTSGLEFYTLEGEKMQ